MVNYMLVLMLRAVACFTRGIGLFCYCDVAIRPDGTLFVIRHRFKMINLNLLHPSYVPERIFKVSVSVEATFIRV